jgi:phosphohistidine phosphatase SixA
MKKLIVIRHPKYDNNPEKMNVAGAKQLQFLLPELKRHVNSKAIVLSSNQPRAAQPAKIIAQNFNIQQMIESEILWSENSKPNENDKALSLIKESKGQAEVVIIVTHFEYCNSFPRYFFEHFLGFKENVKFFDKGEACVIDCKNKSYQIIKQPEN